MGEFGVKCRMLMFVASCALAVSATQARTVNVFFAGGQSNAGATWSAAIASGLQAGYGTNLLMVWVQHSGEALDRWYVTEPRANYSNDFVNATGTGVLQTQIRTITNAGDLAVFRGFFWFQGESDTGSYPAMNAYKDRFLGMMGRLKQDLGMINDVEFTLAVIDCNPDPFYDDPANTGGRTRADVDYLRVVQSNMCVGVHRTYVDTRGYTRSDLWHLTTPEAARLGAAMSVTHTLGSVPAVWACGASASTGSVPLAVTFTESSSGTITNRCWDFGDGVVTNTMSSSVTHFYTNAGTYTVSVIVSGPMGAFTNTWSNPVVTYDPFANTIPYQITFEPPDMKVGDPLLVSWNSNGWYGESYAMMAVVTNAAYAWETELYPVPAATHTNVLLFANASLINRFAPQDAATNNTTVDCMVQPVRTDCNPPTTLITGDQTALYVDTNGFLRVLYGLDASGSNNAWMTFSGRAPLGTSEWARVTLLLDYTGDAVDHGPGDSFFKISINGVPLTPANGSGYGPSGHGYEQNGGDFLRTATPSKEVHVFGLDGAGMLDDLVVTTQSSGFHTLTGSAGAHGAVSPASTNVPPDGSAVFVVTADRYYRISSLTSNGMPVGTFDNNSTCTNFTWSGVQATGTLAALFTAQVANNAAHTPYWWLAQYGLTNGGDTFDAAASDDQDEDGLDAWQEQVVGTDPTNAASVLKLLSITTDGVSHTVKWLSSTGAPSYNLLYRTNLQNAGNGWVSCSNNLVPNPPTNTVTITPPGPTVFYTITVTN